MEQLPLPEDCSGLRAKPEALPRAPWCGIGGIVACKVLPLISINIRDSRAEIPSKDRPTPYLLLGPPGWPASGSPPQRSASNEGSAETSPEICGALKCSITFINGCGNERNHEILRNSIRKCWHVANFHTFSERNRTTFSNCARVAHYC